MENNMEKRSVLGTCPVCGAETGEHFSFCNKCGASLSTQQEKTETPVEKVSAAEENNSCSDPIVDEVKEQVCPVCKASVKSDFHFCNKCGADLSKTPANEPSKETASEPKKACADSLTVPSASKLCPACKRLLPPGATVCPHCRKNLASAERRVRKTNVFRTLSIIAYCAAGVTFFISLISLLSVTLARFSLFRNTNSVSILSSMTCCLFMAMMTLAFTVLGCTFLSLFYRKEK